MGNALERVEAVMQASTSGEWLSYDAGHGIYEGDVEIAFQDICEGDGHEVVCESSHPKNADAIVLAHNLMPHLLRLWAATEVWVAFQRRSGLFDTDVDLLLDQGAEPVTADEALYVAYRALNEAAAKELGDDPAS